MNPMCQIYLIINYRRLVISSGIGKVYYLHSADNHNNDDIFEKGVPTLFHEIFSYYYFESSQIRTEKNVCINIFLFNSYLSCF